MKNAICLLTLLGICPTIGTAQDGVYWYKAFGTNPDGNTAELTIVVDSRNHEVHASGDMHLNADLCSGDAEEVCIHGGASVEFSVPRVRDLTGKAWKQGEIEYSAGPKASHEIVGRRMDLHRIVAKTRGETTSIYYYSCSDGLIAFAKAEKPEDYIFADYVSGQYPAYGAWCHGEGATAAAMPVRPGSASSTACGSGVSCSGWRPLQMKDVIDQTWREASSRRFLSVSTDLDGDGRSDLAELVVSRELSRSAIRICLARKESNEQCHIVAESENIADAMGLEAKAPGCYPYTEDAAGHASEGTVVCRRHPLLGYFKFASSSSFFAYDQKRNAFLGYWDSD